MAAAREVVVSEILCFILNKFGKAPENNIKVIVTTFYNEAEIAAGKELFYQRLETKKLDGLPRLVKRKGDNRQKADVDDLLALINLADQELVLLELPIFVAEDLTRIPSTKPEDLDLVVLARKSTATDDKVNALTTMVAAGSASDDKLNEMASKIAALEVMITTLVSKIGAIPFSVQGTAKAAVKPKIGAIPPSGQKTAAWGGGIPLTTLPEVSVSKEDTVHIPAKNSATAEATELFITDDVGVAFTVVKSKKKKPRKITVGTLEGNSAKINAAKPVLLKSIFHVDNISEKFGPSDIVEHLKSVDIPAVSVFECKSWRKPGPDGEGFKAFRLCIERQNADRIMERDTWPKGILVRPWKFKTATPGTKLSSSETPVVDTKKSIPEAS